MKFLKIFARFIFALFFVGILTFQNFAFAESKLNITLAVDDVTPPASVYWRMEYCRDLLEKASAALPEEHISSLRRLKIVWSSKMERGLGGGHEIHIRCNDISDDELVGVFVHEVGHVVDIGVLTGRAASGSSSFVDKRTSLFNDDGSLDFYRISWTSVKKKVHGSSSSDFVTGYAMTDPFEDFAESYTFYVLHGPEFATMAQQNDRLKRKYEFLRDKIFNDKEFFNNYRKPKIGIRDFDSTIIPFSLEKFLKNR